MDGIVGRRQGGRCREMPQVAVGNFWFVGVLVVGLHKAQGLTQVQLAEQLGVAQQTMAHYEAGSVRIGVATLTEVASALEIAIEDLIGVTGKRAKSGKRGPAPKIQQQLEQIEALPKAKQRAIAQVLDSMLQAHQ